METVAAAAAWASGHLSPSLLSFSLVLALLPGRRKVLFRKGWLPTFGLRRHGAQDGSFGCHQLCNTFEFLPHRPPFSFPSKKEKKLGRRE